MTHAGPWLRMEWRVHEQPPEVEIGAMVPLLRGRSRRYSTKTIF